MHFIARPRLAARLIRTLVLATGALGACRAGEASRPHAAIASITIAPASLTIDRGRSASLRAIVRSTTGEELVGGASGWRVQDSTIASVSPVGLLRAKRRGNTVVVATIGDKAAQASVTVTDSAAGVVTNLRLAFSRAFAWPGDTLRLSLSASDKWLDPIASPNAVWESSDPRVATVTADGVVHAIRAGTAMISASAGIAQAMVPISVDTFALGIAGASALVPDSEAQLYVEARLGTERHTAPGSSTRWTSSDETIVSVSPQGLTAGLRPGTATITAIIGTLSGQTASTPVTVRSLPGRIAYVMGSTVMVARLDGTQAAAVRAQGTLLIASGVALSPNGREIAYDCGVNLCRTSVDGSAPSTRVLAGAASPSWTGDGRSIAAATGSREVTIVDVASAASRHLRMSYPDIARPRISPSGGQIVHECDHTWSYMMSDLCIQATGDGITSHIVNAVAGAWSPDGKQLAFVRNGGICTTVVSSLSLCRPVFGIVTGALGAPEVAWSPDGAHLVVAVADALWIVGSDGTNPVRMRRSLAGWYASPSWSVDP